MRFEAGKANSIELCVAEWVSGSRYRDSITVLAEPASAAPVTAVAVHRRGPVRRLVSFDIATSIRRLAASQGCDLIVTQQHIPTAARISLLNPRVPVILQTHNFIDAPVKGSLAAIKNRVRTLEFGRLSGMTLISEATQQQFERDWPGVAVPRRVITNGADLSGWQPAAVRQKLVLVVGRALEIKGILEAAQGVTSFLRDHADWRAVFMLSATRDQPEYFAAVSRQLQMCGERAELRTNVPFADVRQCTESAAICVVPAKWNEPFGRAAVEAHAGGAALISSGTGGLREISGESALYLSEVSGVQIQSALNTLAADPQLCERLAREGRQRVHRLFRLTGEADGNSGFPSVCQRLDDFFEQVVDASRSASLGRSLSPG